MATGILKTERIISQLGNISEVLSRLFRRFIKVLTLSPFDESISYKKALTLSIEKGSISAAFGSRLLTKIRIKAIKTFSYDPERFPSPEEFASAVSILLGEIKGRSEIDLVIPKSWVVLKTAEFPITVKENLDNVISYEMDRLTPFNIQDVFFDYNIIKEEGGRLSILVALAKKDTLYPYIEALQAKGIRIGKINVSLTAIANLFPYRRSKGYSIFLDVGKDFFEAGIFEGLLPVDYLSAGFETEESSLRVDRILEELQPFFERLKSSGIKPEILLRLRDSSIKEILRARIDYPLIILGETDIRIKLPETKDIPYVAIAGLIESLRRDEGINLLTSGKREKKKIPIFLTTILIVAIVLLSFVYFITPLRIEERRLHAIEEQIAQKKAEVKKVELLKKEVEDLKDEIASINNFKEDKVSSLGILREITMTLPKNTWLTRLRITETGVNIEGYAVSATELLPKLEASRFFRKAEFSSPTFRDARMNADRFIIKTEVETTKKEGEIEKK